MSVPAAPRRLPVVQARSPRAPRGGGALNADGTRRAVYTADVSGRFTRARRVVFVLLMGIYLGLPWVQVGGRPAVLLDVREGALHVFGASFDARDTWILAFLLTGMGFGLVVLTAVAGRVWCGWACPQTVFLDGIFRPLERLVLGSREARQRRASRGWSAGRVARTALLQAMFAGIAVVLAHATLAYFVPVADLKVMLRAHPAAHPVAFAVMSVMAGLAHANLGWFREQLCVVVCPYGRLQGALVDEDTRVIGYDRARGEPRGKSAGAREGGAGDCIDCGRCVAVCPTAIDIRDGLQLDCVACTACIDACDEIMDRLQRARGLIRYDSVRGLEGKPRRFLRPRLAVYAVLLVAGLFATGLAIAHRSSVEATLLRSPGAPYVVDGSTVRNVFQLRVVNKLGRRSVLVVEAEPADGATFLIPISRVQLDPLGRADLPVLVSRPLAGSSHELPVTVRVRADDGDAQRASTKVTAPFLAPQAGTIPGAT